MSFFSKVAKSLTTRKSAKTTNTMARAWEIAQQASKHFNLLPSSLLQCGLSKPSDFFKEALKLAWAELKKQADKFPNPINQPRKANKLLEQIINFAAELAAGGIDKQSEEFKVKVSSQAQHLQSDKSAKSSTVLNAAQLDMFAM